MKRYLPLALIGLLAFSTPGQAGSGANHGDHTRGDHDHGSGVNGFTLGDTPALKQGAAQIMGARFIDVDGTLRRLGDEEGAGPVALVFVDSECPVSSRYLGELNAFAETARQYGIDFYAVVSSPYRNWADAKALRDQYGLNFPVLFDPSGDLAGRLNPVTLGEAFVINEQDRMIYRGRIDDRFAGIGELRRVIRHHDLLQAFEVAHDPNAQGWATAPIGCYFEAWDDVETREASYTRDIEPILAANCVECHQQGGVAPFPLESFEQATARSGMLEYMTIEGLMPPWRPKPHYGRFRDERYLSDTQIALFTAWRDNDDALGQDADRMPRFNAPDPGWRLGEPDLVLEMTEPYQVPATGEDVYRYFVIPSGLIQDQTVIAIDFQPGDPAVVHHANFFADYSGKARAEDANDREPGFSVFGTGEFMSYDNTETDSFGIGGWAPGAEPYSLPDDVGLWLPAGGDIVVEIHYKLNGIATSDRSKIAFYFADRETTDYVDGLLIGTQELDIPAGEESYIRHIAMDVPVGFRLVDVMPHMHYIGTRTRMTVTFPDGRVQPIFGIEEWDLRWQNIYLMRTPLHIPAGSRLDAWFEYDNSDENSDNPYSPPRRMKWGWQSEEEMAEVWLGVIPDDYNRRMELIEATYQTWYYVDSQPFPD